VCTVTLEDYFHAAPLRPWIRAGIWHRFETRLEVGTRRSLELLESCEARATYFVGEELIDTSPDLIRAIAAAGHEVAVRGDLEAQPGERSPAHTLEQAARARDRLEQVVGHQVFGYRAAGGWLRDSELWLLEVLAEAGYSYDSSIRPILFSNSVAVRGARQGRIRELPLAAVSLAGAAMPIGGGAALRLFPQFWVRRSVARWDRDARGPYVMCLRPWELDPEQPRVQSASAAVRLRQYHNLERMPDRLRTLLTAHRFVSAASHLGLIAERVERRASAAASAGAPASRVVAPARPAGAAMPVTVVVPCYNETQSLPYLDRALDDLRVAFAGRYAFDFVFVDDRSSDDTWGMLQTLFGQRSDCILLRHDRNRGIAAAIRTGLQRARADVVCSMDCDCTYDPHELGHMIPLLRDGVDIVTASPYHPEGGVRNVPGWRLVLSKTLSRMYRMVLRQKLFTYTSCFRVYRRESAMALEVERPGFLGIAEMIARLDLAGRRVVEYPTTLEVRVLGQSKMKVLRTVWGHVGLLFDVARLRLRQVTSLPTVTL
jgi:polysaccharide deacetylase family protein (PEP-CTERM system associated)